jgi:hypothetical protein
LVGSSSTSTFAGRAKQARQQQPVALAAGQRTDQRARALRGKQEIAEVADHVLLLVADLDEIRSRRDDIDQRRLFVELTPELVEIGHLHLRPERHPALVGRQFTEDQAQQRRLAGTVGADDADLVAALHTTREVAHHDLVAKALADVFERGHQLAAAVAGIDRQFDLSLPLARAARSRRRRSSRSTRPSLRVRRALIPCLIHTSSWARNLSNGRCSAPRRAASPPCAPGTR